MHQIIKTVRYAPDGFTVCEIAPGQYQELTPEQLAYALRANALAAPENRAIPSAPQTKAKKASK